MKQPEKSIEMKENHLSVNTALNKVRKRGRPKKQPAQKRSEDK